MFLLSGPEKILVFVFLVATMLSLGMQTSVAELRSMLASRGLLWRTLLANFVVVPLVGFAIARIMPLSPETAWALVLLACVPGGISTVQFTSKIKGEQALAGSMLAMLSLLAVVLSPAILWVLLPGGPNLTIPYGAILGFIAIGILVPLGLGILLAERAPGMAPRLGKLVGLVGVVAFVVFSMTTKAFRKEALASIGAPAIGAMILLIVLSMVIGWFMGGPARETRQALATVTSMRNVAMCLAIARGSEPGPVAMAAVLGFSILMVPPNIVLTLFSAIRGRLAARRAGKPGAGTAS